MRSRPLCATKAASDMDIRVLLSTFFVVFLAELGDKTQLTVLSLGSSEKSRWTVFAGASLALIASTLVAVLAAEQITRFVSPRVTQGVAGGMLLIMGAIYLFTALRSG